MQSGRNAARLGVAVMLTVAVYAAGETKKEFRFTVRPHASVWVTNQFGPISVKPIGGNQVVVNATLYSNKVQIEHDQNGNRVELSSRLASGADGESGRVDYVLQVPRDTSLTLRSTTGVLRAERLHGDLSLEGVSTSVEVRDIDHAHVHVNTLNGPITLTNIRDGHVEITSVSGDVTLNSVDGSLVQVSSTSGRIRYEGTFGAGGAYSLKSHTGDIDATVPDDASFNVTARSVKGNVENDFPLQEPKQRVSLPDKASAIVGKAGKAASKVVLRTFSGKIRLKKR
jgi:DUF4097 and DUF4098 domain-containing protein YvlB